MAQVAPLTPNHTFFTSACAVDAIIAVASTMPDAANLLINFMIFTFQFRKSFQPVVSYALEKRFKGDFHLVGKVHMVCRPPAMYRNQQAGA